MCAHTPAVWLTLPSALGSHSSGQKRYSGSGAAFSSRVPSDGRRAPISLSCLWCRTGFCKLTSQRANGRWPLRMTSGEAFHSPPFPSPCVCAVCSWCIYILPPSDLSSGGCRWVPHSEFWAVFLRIRLTGGL